MKLKDFDYKLPGELVAQHPAKNREHARLMVLDRKARKIYDKVFSDITEYMQKGDALILNDTKVMPARLFGKRMTGGRVEIFLLEKMDPISEALLRPGNRLKKGEKVVLESGDEAEILERGEIGTFVKFSRSIDEILDSYGHTPLPPYIKREDEKSDKEDYQTIYAKNSGATASPTAGLHFTDELLEKIRNKGVKISYVTLHTSYGTFAPVKGEEVEDHRMHNEYFNMPKETIRSVKEVKEEGGKVFAVGTTSVRTLEHCFGSLDTDDIDRDINGYTDLFIYPGYKFNVVDCLITNFHLPKSTLLLLVSAFTGRDFLFEAYNHAIEEKYRFYSYGDAMLIL
ncbi:MAG: tRNA preQ1(34) S-adenosylmethionine ribosyltransferase-isomerase QueA [Candidatus Omnitrophica bacterium CG07_land_8_20_14_0_80_42_15]|uniref:S-adenosylmethionine:tRNA ribosyltransferase-isomerase n=1 Tax=Candidatus Aquitaenariimonas noxiae TaxID=1974741 RepID=A0A2J0KVY9_9BACT|nr:MAG: tRNA preQ1(34) S-adenosylmethionine ribosyltransferase-isomerase QueA [Candidatus Omnitrophica bacterium CG07_land_8_20_14_0_80_42_15]